MSEDVDILNVNESADTLLEAKISIGERLQTERQKQNLSLVEVAEKLHLPKRVIEAIEKNNFTAHPGITFMRGYLNTYTKFLHLPVTEIMADFHALNIAPHTPNINIKPQMYRERKSASERWFRYATIFIIICLCGLVVVWWQSHSISQNVVTKPTSISPQLGQKTDNMSQSLELPKVKNSSEMQTAVVNESEHPPLQNIAKIHSKVVKHSAEHIF